MELETLFTEQKWNILKCLCEEKYSPLQLASKLNTSIANISQQLRLLEAANLVKTERVPSRDKGKPRKLFSLTHNYAYIIATMDGFAEKRLLKLTSYHKIILKIWFLEKPELQYHLEKIYWKLEEYFDKIKAIALRQTNEEVEIILICDKPKEVERNVSSVLKPNGIKLNLKIFTENEATQLLNHKKNPFSSPETLSILYEDNQILSRHIHKKASHSQ